MKQALIPISVKSVQIKKIKSKNEDLENQKSDRFRITETISKDEPSKKKFQRKSKSIIIVKQMNIL